MAGFVAAAIVGGAVVSGIASSSAASTQADAAERAAVTGATGAVRVAEIDAESNERAAALQAQAYIDAARALELGAVGAGGIEFPTSRAPGNNHASRIKPVAIYDDSSYAYRLNLPGVQANVLMTLTKRYRTFCWQPYQQGWLLKQLPNTSMQIWPV
jgi:hypothetical protein